MTTNAIKISVIAASVVAVMAASGSWLLAARNDTNEVAKDTSTSVQTKPADVKDETTDGAALQASETASVDNDVVSALQNNAADNQHSVNKPAPVATPASAPVQNSTSTIPQTPVAEAAPVAPSPTPMPTTPTEPTMPIEPVVTPPAPDLPAPVDPAPQPSYRVELRVDEAYLFLPQQFPGMPAITDQFQIITPFSVISDEGFTVKDHSTTRMDCRIIAAPSPEHGVLCHADMKDVGLEMMLLQFNYNNPCGEYTVELIYTVDGITRTDTMDFVLFDASEMPDVGMVESEV